MVSVRRLFEFPSIDPDDIRRRKLLNLLLTGATLISVAAIIVLSPLATGISAAQRGVSGLLLASIACLGGSLAIFAINRFWSSKLASFTFLALLILVISISDAPNEVAAGRTLFAFTVPIIMASVVLFSFASFGFAALSSLVIVIIAVNAHIEPNIPAILGFFLVALVSWISSHSLERTLVMLRAANQDLDQRVKERTRDLSLALERERAETGKHQAILESIVDGVLVIDPSGQIIVANAAIALLLGQPVKEMLNLPVDRLFDQDSMSENDREMLKWLLSRPATENASIRIHYRKKTLSVNAAQVLEQDGRALGQVAVFRDFTREAEVEEMKSVFLATVSHEMRTPLNAILGYVEMLRETVYGPLTGMQANITERVMNNTRRLLAIVNDLLDQAQIEAGKVTLHIRNFTSMELLDNLRSVMEKIVRDKGLTLNCTIAPSMPAILAGDPERLQQILVNLVNNAVKFTASGQIHVHIFQPDASHWAMRVSDTGSGIPADAQKYVFDPFRQADPSTTRRHGGIGLGLSIVKSLVVLMKGNISLQSQEGQGSTFTVVLPRTTF